MELFATVDDVEAGFRDIVGSERDRAERLLMEATVRIMSDVGWNDAKVDEVVGEAEQAQLNVLCASMVRNALRPTTPSYGGYDSEGSFGEWSSDVVANNPYKSSQDRDLVRRLHAGFKGGGIGFWRQ